MTLLLQSKPAQAASVPPQKSPSTEGHNHPRWRANRADRIVASKPSVATATPAASESRLGCPVSAAVARVSIPPPRPDNPAASLTTAPADRSPHIPPAAEPALAPVSAAAPAHTPNSSA